MPVAVLGMNQWNEWIQHNALDGGFLQSLEWSEFQRALGRRVENVVIPASEPESTIGSWSSQDDSTLQTIVIEQQLPLGQTYVYSPRGPVVGNHESGIMNNEFKTIVQEVAQRFPKAIFWRVDPLTKLPITNYQLLRARRAVQPSTTLIVDCSKTEEELLAQMKQKTRYNIKVAQKHEVVVRRIMNNELGIMESFLDLLGETAKRDGFRTHAREYYRKLLALTPTLSHGARGDATDPLPSGEGKGEGLSIELYGAFQGDTLLAGAIVAFFGQWAYYLHGASNSQNREMMAPYLLHWEIMREAKRRGCTRYDLWGAGEEWPGVSKFKTGFAPATSLTQYPGTFDVVLQPWKYRLYRLGQRLR